MNFLDAAYEILKQASKPLHYAQITRLALKTNILDTKGQTPEATMSSRLYVDTKRANSRFRRVSRNIFGLAEPPAPEITSHIHSINDHTRAELQKRLLQMPPDRFEALVAELLLALGFDEETLQATPFRNDGGIDVRGILKAGNITDVNAAVQVKRWKSNVQAPVVQALRGSLTVHEQGIIITTSKFSKGAQQEAQATGKSRISLVDGERLLDLLIEHEIGVKTEQYALHSLDEDWWIGITGISENREIQVDTEPIVSLDISYPLVIQAQAKGKTILAELISPKGQIRLDGIEYDSPSGAGQVITGWKSCNGWSLWHFQDPSTGEWKALDELRLSSLDSITQPKKKRIAGLNRGTIWTSPDFDEPLL